ncbi:hypothetical protein FCG67_11990 [Rhodococcus oryzae]|uniref:MaoC-like domain-containing protein n=1 Tax=Rhodococcus oryzae TaxID=2571143 RepID=A0ABY2RJW9_9NOCA|nr:hypothetical protein FCG67_11990 [Rhodococcus oryzae]
MCSGAGSCCALARTGAPSSAESASTASSGAQPSASRRSPFGGTIAHGNYTLSLGPRFSYAMFGLDGFAFALNCGFDRVRLPAPLPVGSRVRMRAVLSDISDIAGGVQIAVTQTFEREGTDKPVCVAEMLTRAYTG